jgi:hypothetical protein
MLRRGRASHPGNCLRSYSDAARACSRRCAAECAPGSKRQQYLAATRTHGRNTRGVNRSANFRLPPSREARADRGARRRGRGARHASNCFAPRDTRPPSRTSRAATRGGALAPTSVGELAPTSDRRLAPTSVRGLAPTRRSHPSTDKRQSSCTDRPKGPCTDKRKRARTDKDQVCTDKDQACTDTRQFLAPTRISERAGECVGGAGAAVFAR